MKKLIRQKDVLSKSAKLIQPKVKMVTVSWIFPLQKIYMRLLLVQLCLKKKKYVAVKHGLPQWLQSLQKWKNGRLITRALKIWYRNRPQSCVAIQNGQDHKSSTSKEFCIPRFGDSDEKLRYSIWQELSHHKKRCAQSSTTVQAYQRTKKIKETGRWKGPSVGYFTCR